MASDKVNKEGGWGYVVAFSSFIIHVIVCGVIYSAGVFHLALLDTFKENQLWTSLITTPLFGLTAVSGILATWVMYGIGYRFTVILGAILAGLGFGLSLLVEEYYQAIIAAVGVGLGFGLVLKSSLASISAYFYNNHGSIINMVSVGATVGGFTFPIGLYFIHTEWDWPGTCMSMVIACALLVICGAVLEPNGPSPKTFKPFLRMFDCSLFRCVSFWAILFSNLFWSLGASAIYVHFPNYMNDSITSREESVILVSGIGAANFASRVMFVMFSVNDHFDHVTVCLCTVGLTTILTGLFKELFKTYAGKIGYVIIFGFHSGFWTTFVSNLAEDVIGKPYIGYGRGYIALSIGLGLAGGGPLGGFLRDNQGDYEATFYMAGASLLAASLIMIMINFRKCYYVPWGHGTPAASVNGDDKNQEHTSSVATLRLLSSV